MPLAKRCPPCAFELYSLCTPAKPQSVTELAVLKVLDVAVVVVMIVVAAVNGVVAAGVVMLDDTDQLSVVAVLAIPPSDTVRPLHVS